MKTALLWTITLLLTYVVGVLISNPLLKKLRKAGFVGRDMYKAGHPKVPEMGGIGIALAFLTGILFLSVIHPVPYVVYLMTFVLMLYFFFGLLDDIVGVGGALKFTHNKWVKILIPLFLIYPLVNYVDTAIFIPIYGNIGFGTIYIFTILPFYVMVTANLINMYSYYNGQSAGATLIVVLFASLKLYQTSRFDVLFILFPFIGATLAFLSYNLQPAGVFPGDSGDMFMGAVIGLIAVIGELEVFIFIALLPMTVNFVMVAAWFIKERGEIHVKFGKVREDNTIDPPNPYTLMWIFPYYFRLDERNTTLIMFGLIFLSSITALVFL